MFKKSGSSVNSFKFCVVAVVWLLAAQAHAYQATDFSWIPPFLAKDEKPSITIIFDNSGSMLQRAYTGTFNPTNEYYGYFDPQSSYSYQDNSGTANDYFYEDEDGQWNGNWLNWATMHRVDVARKVMTGGTYASGYYEISSQDSANRVTAFSYDDSTAVTDLNGDTKYMTPLQASITSIDHTVGSNTITMSVSSTSSTKVKGDKGGGQPGSSTSSYTYTLRVQGDENTGVIQAFEDKARMALFIYDTASPYHLGGKCLAYMSEDSSTIDSIVSSINSVFPSTWTPLAETLYTVMGYIKQDNTYNSSTGPRYRTSSYTTSTTTDPYYFADTGTTLACTRQNVILITDGESTQDQGIPTTIQDAVDHPRSESDYNLSSYGSSYLIDVAYTGHTTDLRSDLDDTQSFDFYAVYAFGSGSNLLADAARYGGFTDSNDNDLPDLQSEYDADADGVPDNYFEAESGQDLETAVTSAFQLATATVASGTSAAVTSDTDSGEGAVYQALFFPPTSSTEIAPPWSGQVHAFLLDDEGNLREDTNGNRVLDLIADKIILFDDDTIYRYTDTNGDASLSATEISSTKEILSDVNDIAFLWSSSTWLNDQDDTEVVLQRSYASTDCNRYIFTFVDKNQNMVADSGEVQDFELASAPATGTLNSANYFYNYLTLYPSKSGSISLDSSDDISTLRSSSPSSFASLQASLAKRQVDFIRGANVGSATISGITDTVRDRSGSSSNYRLGDIIYSSPTVVGSPSESYHTIYNDSTYAAFLTYYANRRQVIYAGANDGMLHAFNGGFYNSTTMGFDLSRNGASAFPLGMELWGYIPYNLLPHLRWLMNSDYGSDLHVAYMDLKPRIFDARIFFDSDGITARDSAHPEGWGTVLVAGMRLGGAAIQVDIDKTDGNSFNATADREMTSAYVIMDITNPEEAPRLLAEIHMPDQGYTTCYPTVMPMTTPDATSAAANQWYLVFGSGPANSDGEADRAKLGVETSDQAGHLYVLDLKELATNANIRSLNTSGTFQDGATTFSLTEANSFVSGPGAVDLDIGSNNASAEFKTNVVYYGTVSGDQTTGGGTLRRLLSDNAMPVSNTVAWTGNSTLIDVGKPVTAEPAVATDDDGNVWVYFGAGRYFNRDDIPQGSSMSFYGVKEPVTNGNFSWSTVDPDDLYDSTQITLVNATCGDTYTPSCVQVVNSSDSSTMTWYQLVQSVAASAGWVRDMDEGWERVIGLASVYSGSIIFTSYVPSEDLCSSEGVSYLWALYYLTGTPYYDPILTGASDTFAAKISLGPGLAITPSLYSGSSSSKAFVQTSTGAIKIVDLNNPLTEKSGALFWDKRQND